MKAKFNKENKFMWSAIKVHLEGEEGYKIEQSTRIHPVGPNDFSNIRKVVRKELVRGDGKCLYCILSNKNECYEVFMFAKTTSEDEFIAYEHKIADLIVKQKLDKDEQLRLF